MRSLSFIINIGATAVIIVLFAVLNLFIDKYITNQADKVSLKFMNTYLQKTYDSIYLRENEYASDMITFIKKSIEKDT